MGRRLAKSISAVRGVVIKYVFGRTFALAEKLARDCGASAVNEISRVFDDEKVDAAFVCQPTFTRLETLRKAVDSSKHLFCEKPIALDQPMADAIRSLLAGYSKVVMVGHVLRFSWEYRRLRDRVLAGEVGQVGIVRLSRCVGYPGAGSWFTDVDKSGGVILDLLIHDLDFLRWTFGEAKHVYAKSGSCAGKLDYALLNLQLSSGALAHVEGSWAHPVGSFHQTVEICGSLGLLHYDNLTCANLKVVPTAESHTGPASRISLPDTDPSNDPYFAEVTHFIDCIRQRREPAVSYEDALKSCELAFRAIESARLGAPVIV
jgi:predicted dehydrogenase